MRLRPIPALVQSCSLLVVMSILIACGSGGSSLTTVTNPPPQPTELLYAATLAGQVATQKIDTNTGTLSSAAVSTGSNGVSITLNPAGTFLYAADLSSNAIDAFSISSTGTLSTMSGSPFSAPGSGGINGVTIDTTGRFLYASGTTASGGTGTGIIAVFSIDSATGALSPVTGSPFAAGTSSGQLMVDPSGHLYVGDANGGVLASSTSSGVITPIAGSPFPSGSRGLAITPNGKYLYAIDVSTVVTAYTIDPSSGSLTQVSGSPFLEPTGGAFSGRVIVDPKGKFLYVYNTFGQVTISGLAIDDSTGALSVSTGSPFAAVQSTLFAANMAIEPSGKFLYASCSDGTCGILAFSIDATSGALTPVTGSPFNAANYVGGMAPLRLQ